MAVLMIPVFPFCYLMFHSRLLVQAVPVAAAAAERLPMQLFPVKGVRQAVLQHLFLCAAYDRDVSCKAT